jgi:uncharacterized membrane protein YcaP (DUF421 family)
VEPVIRVAVMYVFLLVCFRIIGKRELGEMSPFELVTLLMVPEIISPALTTEDISLTGAIAGACTLFVIVFAVSALSQRFRKVNDLVEGGAVVIVRHGQFIEKRMTLERVQPREVLSEMHRSGVDDLEKVKWAILEPDGKISIIPVGGQGG